MNLLNILIYIYLLLRPLYFFKSGGLQISDIVFLAAFFVFLIVTSKNKKKFLEIIKSNIYYLLFVVLIIVINLFYYIIYLDSSFLLSSLYYIFNLFIIIVFSYLFENQKFIENMNKIIKLNLIIQLIICIFGIGNYWKETFRYMGTFNDPNQFAYYILISYCLISLFDIVINKKSNMVLYFFMCVYLILKSSSTGMLLGISIVAILSLADIAKNIINFIKSNKKKLIIISYLLLIIILTILLFPNLKSKLYNELSNTKIIERIDGKISKSKDTSGNDLWHDRGYDTIYSYPRYIIFGAGQGQYIRFQELTGHDGEIHATLPSILFYYGIVPTIFLLIWIYKKLKYIPFKCTIIYISVFLESFTLLNQRQALFWIIILLGSNLKKSNYKVKRLGYEKNS